MGKIFMVLPVVLLLSVANSLGQNVEIPLGNKKSEMSQKIDPILNRVSNNSIMPAIVVKSTSVWKIELRSDVTTSMGYPTPLGLSVKAWNLPYAPAKIALLKEGYLAILVKAAYGKERKMQLYSLSGELKKEIPLENFKVSANGNFLGGTTGGMCNYADYKGEALFGSSVGLYDGMGNLIWRDMAEPSDIGQYYVSSKGYVATINCGFDQLRLLDSSGKVIKERRDLIPEIPRDGFAFNNEGNVYAIFSSGYFSLFSVSGEQLYSMRVKDSSRNNVIAVAGKNAFIFTIVSNDGVPSKSYYLDLGTKKEVEMANLHFGIIKSAQVMRGGYIGIVSPGHFTVWDPQTLSLRGEYCISGQCLGADIKNRVPRFHELIMWGERVLGLGTFPFAGHVKKPHYLVVLDSTGNRQAEWYFNEVDAGGAWLYSVVDDRSILLGFDNRIYRLTLEERL